MRTKLLFTPRSRVAMDADFSNNRKSNRALKAADLSGNVAYGRIARLRKSPR